MVYAGLLAAHRKAPVRWWMGPRKLWLRGHLWLGLLSAVFIVLSLQFLLGGFIETLLCIVLIGVLLTASSDSSFKQAMPKLLTARVPCEAPFEQIPHLCDMMRRNADEIVDQVCGPHDPSPNNVENTLAAAQYASDARAQLRDFYESDVRKFCRPTLRKTVRCAIPCRSKPASASCGGCRAWMN